MGNSCSPNLLDLYQQDSSSQHFEVYNVDAKLFKHSKGHITIKNNQMTYEKCSTTPPPDMISVDHIDQHQINWPLNGIRRYGHYKDIFLFESGRKCPAGEGLFAFKCNKAKRLSNELHKAILVNASSLCNLQRNPSKKSYTDQDGVANRETQTLTTNVSDEQSSFASATTNTKNYDLNENITLSSYSEIKPNLNNSVMCPSSNEAASNKSPYYVNDLKSIVRLPPSLSFINSEESKKQTCGQPSDYVNSELIDPNLLQLAKKLNMDRGVYVTSPFYSHITTKKKNYEKLKDLLSSSSSSKLIYVTPDFMGLNNNNNKSDKPNEANKMIPISNKNSTKIISNTKQSDSKMKLASMPLIDNGKTEYVTIDPKKTQVIKSTTTSSSNN